MARIRAATNYRLETLGEWQWAEAPTASADCPDFDALAELSWQAACVPGTVASALRQSGGFSFDSRKDFDAADFWYRVRFESTPVAPTESVWLLCGLATLADVWLNGQHLLRSENMYLEHALDVSRHLERENELLLRFSSLNAALSLRRPRPRFRTRLIERQQLRWFRTTFLGRMPGWTPPVAAVGPWRGVRLERRHDVSLQQVELTPSLELDRAVVRARVTLQPQHTTIKAATLRVGNASAPLDLVDGGTRLTGELFVPEAKPWWPNGYGAQPLYDAQLSISTESSTHVFELDALGFRSIAQAPDRPGFALLVNGVEVRCRGACWAPTDIVSLNDEQATVTAVAQAQAAGMNMLRVGGTMIYESDAFYAECDRRGILVWQDYMFANCDYPEEPAFVQSVRAEVEQFLARTETRACLAVLCGSSEVEQQISMLGLPKELWKPPLFERVLREISAAARPSLPYVSSSPSGGPLPFQADTGVTHYYGVGAYLRPLEDARRASVKFASECLAFANIPEPSSVEGLLGDRAPFHHPLWKERVPRDHGASWDFDDVRDHYVKLLFGVDPMLLRYQDVERALAVGRVVTGEVMARTLAEWRREASPCRGALIWLFRDLWPGAGWGLIDANGLPKAAYYYVKRAMQPRAVFISDEGVNGLALHVVNDHPAELRARLELTLWRGPATRVASGATSVVVAPHGGCQVSASTLFDHFIDSSNAYRFGPAVCDVAVAALHLESSQEPVGYAHHFIGDLSRPMQAELGITATAEGRADGSAELCLNASSCLQSVTIEAPGFTPDDSYFHLSPGQEQRVLLTPQKPGVKLRGSVRALNAASPTRIVVGSQEKSGGG